MVAPTPVSALVHSSTLVTAGVYLLFRFSWSESNFLLNTGILTTLIGGFAALIEVDVKRIVAFSTLSQLGVIFIGLGLGFRTLCFFHLNCHAMFKALLFISVGVLIHTRYGSQEGRSLLCLPYCAPWLLICIVVSRLSMCGLVFLSGWATKDAVFESLLNHSFPCSSILLFYVSIGITIVYSIRLILLSLGYPSSFPVISQSSPSSILLLLPMGLLLLLGVIEGICLVTSSVVTFSPLSYYEKFMVYFLFLITPYLSFLSNNGTLPTISRVTSYTVFGSLLSSGIARMGSAYYLESSSIQSLGLSKASSLLGWNRGLGFLTTKVFVFLGCALVLF